MLGGGVTGHGLLQLDPDDERGVVGARPQVRHRRQRRYAAGRARGFVPRGRRVPELVADRGRHRPEVALSGEHLTEGVCDVDNSDVGGVHLRRGERALDDLCGQSREVTVLFAEIASEIALVAAENPHACRAVHTPHGTPGRRCSSPAIWAVPSALGLNRRDLGGRGSRLTRLPPTVHCHPRRLTNIAADPVACATKWQLKCGNADLPLFSQS